MLHVTSPACRRRWLLVDPAINKSSLITSDAKAPFLPHIRLAYIDHLLRKTAYGALDYRLMSQSRTFQKASVRPIMA